MSADDIPFWFWTVPSMPPGQSDMREFRFTVSSAQVPVGTYYLVVRADDGDQVSESNENNNVVSAGPITLKSSPRNHEVAEIKGPTTVGPFGASTRL